MKSAKKPRKARVVILGSTGSVGLNTLNVIRQHSARFEVAGLAAGAKADILGAQSKEFGAERVYLRDARSTNGVFGKTAFFTEKEGFSAFLKGLDYDILVAASSGTNSLPAVLGALAAGKRVALANKEVMVVAGGLVMSKLKANPKASLIPIDSEHSAIFQCLAGANGKGVEKIILTGSGGPLREVPVSEFRGIPKSVVINHPKWKMGQKISVDSATMMNKGLEIIEASWLFGLPIEKIDILIHPEAVVHSMVEFRDGAVLAQLGATDMRLPIQYALSYPERLKVADPLKLDLSSVGRLTFLPPDRKKFPCLDLAYHAAKKSGSAPCVLSAADEVAVEAFLENRIDFIEIPRVIEKVLSKHRYVADPGLREIGAIHRWAADEARGLCGFRASGRMRYTGALQEKA